MVNYGIMTDDLLAERYIGGDNRAFDELLKRTQSKVFNYIMCVVKDQALADDLFQDTFVKIIDKLQTGQYTEHGKFQAWATRIAHNLIMDYFRHEKASKIIDTDKNFDLATYRGSAALRESRENEIVYDQTLVEAQRLMEYLPAPQKEVVFMRYYQNLSFKEIADITNVSINTALGRMRYAVLNMRRMARQQHL
ncbi:MAG: sigma-70 family RNA polymerase sigma factor [Bacteroidaceae bacterium]|nr:sigma-70 family RNA polymerase sigma factor [Bacteroidaceae bacterium]